LSKLIKTREMIKKHQLTVDFPEFEAKIHELKVSDNHFKKLFEEYDTLDHDVYRIESDAEPASDDTLNNLRVERVRVKDEIYAYLKEN
jgi:uncharacterized protein